MNSICRIDISKTKTLLCPVQLQHNKTEYPVRSALLDTGATICHMTYPLWLIMGLNEACWNRNSELCKLMGIASPNDMTFDTLPFISTVSILGDGSHVKVFEFRLDALELGKPSLGFNHSIKFENITVRLINRKDPDFIVGWNVLKYLQPSYDPSPDKAIYQFELTDKGRRFFIQDRDNKVNNYMHSMFNYQQSTGG